MKTITSFLPCLAFAQSNETHIEQVGTLYEGFIKQEPGNIINGSQSGNYTGNGFDGSPLEDSFSFNSPGVANPCTPPFADP